MNTLICIIVILVCVGQAHFQRARSTVCGERGMSRFDDLMAKYAVIGDSSRRFPETSGNDLTQFCNDSKRFLKEIDELRKVCFKDMAKQITSMIVYNGKSYSNKICKVNSQESKRFLYVTPCMNQGIKEIKKCHTQMIDSVLAIAELKDDKMKIPHLCCQYVKSLPCLEKGLSKVPKCNEDVMSAYFDLVDANAGNIMDTMCGDYNKDTDKCDKLGAPPKRSKTQKRTKSIALPMIKILQSFPEI